MNKIVFLFAVFSTLLVAVYTDSAKMTVTMTEKITITRKLLRSIRRDMAKAAGCNVKQIKSITVIKGKRIVIKIIKTTSNQMSVSQVISTLKKQASVGKLKLGGRDISSVSSDIDKSTDSITVAVSSSETTRSSTRRSTTKATRLTTGDPTTATARQSSYVSADGAISISTMAGSTIEPISTTTSLTSAATSGSTSSSAGGGGGGGAAAGGSGADGTGSNSGDTNVNPAIIGVPANVIPVVAATGGGGGGGVAATNNVVNPVDIPAVSPTEIVEAVLDKVLNECGYNDQKLNQYRQEALDKHNELRSRHGVPPLVLDNTLNTYAQAWAEHIAKVIGKLEHRPRSGTWKQLYGENINLSGHTTFSGDEFAAGMYTKEMPLWDWASNSFIYQAGHFTQIVWKDSCKLGVGLSFSPDCSKHYAVYNFDPPGNYAGEFDKNVLPVGSSASTNTCG